MGEEGRGFGDERLRRVLDVTASWAGIVLLSPLLIIIGVLVKVQDRGLGITIQGDRRVTKLGRCLRRTKLDELPQLFNVLLGDMSLVGARPEDPRYVARHRETEREILRHRTGITSPASLAFRAEAELLTGPDWETRYVNDVLPAKQALDLAYLSQRRFMDDVALIFRTVRGVNEVRWRRPWSRPGAL